jgi:anti-sigma B factor antagonist
MSSEDATLDGGAHLLVLTGELDLSNVGDLRRRVDAALQAGHTRLVMDLAAVTHLDSSALAELLRALRATQEARGGLALVVTSTALRRTLEIRGLDRLFTIASTRAEASAALH